MKQRVTLRIYCLKHSLYLCIYIFVTIVYTCVCVCVCVCVRVRERDTGYGPVIAKRYSLPLKSITRLRNMNGSYFDQFSIAHWTAFAYQ